MHELQTNAENLNLKGAVDNLAMVHVYGVVFFGFCLDLPVFGYVASNLFQ